MSEKRCCGTCIWHQYESVDQGWVCVNPDSEYCSDWTEFDDGCIDWSGQEDEKNEQIKSE